MSPVQLLVLTACQAVGFFTSSEAIAYENRRLKFITLRLGSIMGVVAWATLNACFCRLLLTHGQVSNFVIAGCEMIAFPIFAHVDISVRKVPTSLLRLGSGVIFLTLAFSGGYEAITRALLFTVTYCAPLVAMKLFSARAIGSGDIRLGVLIGPILSNGFSLLAVPVMLIVSCALATAFVIGVRLVQGVKLERIPLVPFLLAAVVVLQVAYGFGSD